MAKNAILEEKRMRLPLIFFICVCIHMSAFAQLPDCQVNNYSREVGFSGNKLVEYTEMELQINTAKGLSYAEIELPYSKGNRIKELQAGIYDALGNNIRTLKKKDMVRSNAFSYAAFHSDDMKLSFKLLHNRYPYIIKYSYQTEASDYISMAYWMPRSLKEVPVKNASLTVEVPHDLSVSLFEQGVTPAVGQHVNGKVIYRWHEKDIEYVEREKFGPQSRELQAQVVVIPDRFNYGVEGSSDSWQHFGAWLSALKADSNVLPEAERKRVRHLTQDCTSDVEKINVLYKYLQENTRYINVALDIGGLKPETAQYVCTNKYGDCKALTNYMQALLEEVGIPSVYTTVYAGQHPVKIKQAYPSQQFNHVILCVPQPKDTIWLECTDKTAPFNYLGTFTQNREVLLVDGDESKLVRTPALTQEQVADDYTSRIDVKPDGVVQMETTAKLRGRVFDYLKNLNDGLPQRDKIDYIEELELVEHADIVDFTLNRLHADSSFIQLTLDSRLNNAVESIGERSLIKPLRPFYINLEKPEKRTQELRLSYPFNVSDTLIYRLSRPILRMSGLINVQLDTPYGSYTKQVDVDGHRLIITRQISISAGTYDVDEYHDFYDFMNQCRDAELQKGIVEYL